MKHIALSLGIAALLASIPGATMAESFERIEGRDSFLSVVKNRALTRLGIRLQVTHDGQIKGRAFGREVSGDWKWQSGYFCRDLNVGGDELGANCQLVQVNGNTIRFTSDQGQGEYADLRIK